MEQDQHPRTITFNIWLPFLLSAVLVSGMLIGMRMDKAVPEIGIEDEQEPGITAANGKIEELLRYIEAKYVDEIDRDKLVDEAIQSILEQLDPHSIYISPDQLLEVNSELEGNFDGIGVEFMIQNDTIIVVTTLAGGPSEAVGIMAGDKIVQVEDSTIAGVHITEKGVKNLLMGERGTKVTIGVIRGKETRIRRFSITRDRIPINSVDVSYMLDEKTGYIKISKFIATTYEEFMKALEQLVENEGMQNLVIDLRQNPGGYLQQATNILSQLFQEKDRLLVYTEGRNVHRTDYETNGRAFFQVKDIVVLIDEGSASASEILAGAIQDQDRGFIIGRRSFGKGLVQLQYKLRDGSALRLSVARYYTPSGRSIQKSYENREEYQNESLWERLQSGELSSEDQIAVLDSTKYYTSAGRVVYGGGGIIPDFFVPIDTIFFQEELQMLRQHSRVYANLYTENNRSELSRFSLDQFVTSFHPDEAAWKPFLQYAAERNPALKKMQLNKKAEITAKNHLKAEIGRALFQEPGFFKVLNQDDPMVLKAQEVLNNRQLLTGLRRE